MIRWRTHPNLAFALWGIGGLAAGLLMKQHQILKGFDEQPLPVQIGAYLGLLVFITAAIFSGYVLIASFRGKSAQELMTLLPSSSRRFTPSMIALRASCAACALSFVGFCMLILNAILGG